MLKLLLYIYIYIYIYMLQLEGCIIYEKENKACKLKKSLYDLNQDPKQ
jgi:hypothetical protein